MTIPLLGGFLVVIGILMAGYGLYGVCSGNLWSQLRGLPITKLRDRAARLFGFAYSTCGVILIASGITFLVGSAREAVLYGIAGIATYGMVAFIAYFSGRRIQE